MIMVDHTVIFVRRYFKELLCPDPIFDNVTVIFFSSDSRALNSSVSLIILSPSLEVAVSNLSFRFVHYTVNFIGNLDLQASVQLTILPDSSAVPLRALDPQELYHCSILHQAVKILQGILMPKRDVR